MMESNNNNKNIIKTKKAPLLGSEGAASCTSFYTNEIQQDSYPTLDMIWYKLYDTSSDDDNNESRCCYKNQKQLIYDILYSIEQITYLLRNTLVYVSGTENDFGDVQLSVDLKADTILWNMAQTSNVIHYAASEEDPILRDVRVVSNNHNEQQQNEEATVKEQDNGGYIVCWDPLDGSSIVDNNWAVGTIIGVWPTITNSHNKSIDDVTTNFTNGTITGRHQITSIMAMYGPRTTVLIVLNNSTYEFTYICPNTTDTTTTKNDNDDDDQQQQQRSNINKRMEHTGQYWICTRQRIQISTGHHPDKPCRIFSPANLRVTSELTNYNTIIQYYMKERYTLRYTGGLVPDIYQQFTKGMGIYMNPIRIPNSPPKLRLTFEVAPIALLLEKAGAITSDCCNNTNNDGSRSSSSSNNNDNTIMNTIHSVLDIPITSIDQRTAFCGGSKCEVIRFHTMMME